MIVTIYSKSLILTKNLILNCYIYELRAGDFCYFMFII